jgi:hypothetical protein
MRLTRPALISSANLAASKLTGMALRPERRPSDARRELSHFSVYCFSDNDMHRA